MNDYNKTRINMIEQQIRPWDVLDETVLDLYRVIPREEFVADPDKRDLAFADVALPAGGGQVMLEPKLEARMLQTLALGGSERVLHIGTGSGFFACLLSRLAAEVVSVEILPELAEVARQRLDRVRVIVADGARGMPDEGLFDAVVLTGSTPKIAPELWQNVRDGGRLLAVEGVAPVMTLTLIQKLANGAMLRRDILETCIPVLQNAPPAEAFSF